MRQILSWIIPVLLFVSCGDKPGNTTDTTRKDSVPKTVQRIDSSRPGLIVLTPMTVARKSAYESHYLRLNDSVLYCAYNGVFEIADTLGAHKRKLFDLDAEFLVDMVYFHRMTPRDYFVNWQETDHLGVKTYFAQYTEGEKDANWKWKIEAPSPGQPVVDSPFVYVSTLGMIAKVNMNSGAVVWKHDSLFNVQSLAFKKFDRPKVYTNSVCFYDFPIKGKKNKRDTIWVDDRSGMMR
jgi:hypothetical protein